MNYVTIPELSALNNISANSIRFQFYKNNIEPVDEVRWTINGYTGKPFKRSDAEKVIFGFVSNPDRSKKLSHAPKEKLKRYSSEEVCKVLRNHLKSNLWNKQISMWNVFEWKEFEYLKFQNK